nr:MAG TPA: putative histidine triad family protein [Caudoviricetes sp.]
MLLLKCEGLMNNHLHFLPRPPGAMPGGPYY